MQRPMELEDRKLGAINLLQSTVHLMQGDDRMAEFLATEKNRGSIRVTCRACQIYRSQYPELPPGEYARLLVKDTGKGIPVHVMPRINVLDRTRSQDISQGGST